jgi:hypothetical protein
LAAITIQVEVPLPEGSFEKMPPTDIYVIPEKSNDPDKPDIDNALELVKCPECGQQEVCGVKLKSILVEIKFKDGGC